MKSIALFHFHQHLPLCAARIALLRQLNPTFEIHGLFGGSPEHLADALTLASELASFFHDDNVAPSWNKWKSTDRAVARWYSHRGHALAFDRVHVIQWDLLFFQPLAQAYASLPENAVWLSGLIPLSEVEPFWDWTAREPLRSESLRLLAVARERFNYKHEPFACVGPGYSLPREFLARYAALGLEDLGHDELRLPLFGQILGFPCVDTGFYRWRDPRVQRLFNADAVEIEPQAMAAELASPRGRRVFHPCRERYDAARIQSLTAATVSKESLF
jgi:hypothetical protein